MKASHSRSLSANLRQNSAETLPKLDFAYATEIVLVSRFRETNYRVDSGFRSTVV
jgi:hypothetical protein